MSAAGIVRDARQAAGLTQRELAQRLGTTQPFIARLERDGANPTVQTLDRVLRATGHRLQLLAPTWGDIDVHQIREHLKLSPGQRIERLEQTYAQARELALAAGRSRGELA